MQLTAKNLCLSGFLALSGLLGADITGAWAQTQGAELSPQRSYPKVSVVATGLSHHFGKTTYREYGRNRMRVRHFNEINVGGGVEYRLNRYAHISGAVYDNSINNPSVVIAVGVETKDSRMIALGVEGGMVTGYDGMWPVMPGAYFYARILPRDKFNLRVMTVPKKNPIVAVTARIPLYFGLLR